MRAGHRIWIDEVVAEQVVALDSGVYEPEAMELCRHFIGPDSTCLDIGANIGFFSLDFAGSIEPARGGRVYAFEPVKKNHKRLVENIALNGFENRIHAHRLALGDETRDIVLHIMPGGETNNAVADVQLKPHDRLAMEQGNWLRDTAPMTTLDAWHADRPLPKCDLIKMDVEGAELRVLAGARKFIGQHRPPIVGEFNPYWLEQGGQTFNDALDYFSSFDYACLRLVDNKLMFVTPDLMASAMEIPTYLCIPTERIEEIPVQY